MRKATIRKRKIIMEDRVRLQQDNSTVLKQYKNLVRGNFASYLLATKNQTEYKLISLVPNKTLAQFLLA